MMRDRLFIGLIAVLAFWCMALSYRTQTLKAKAWYLLDMNVKIICALGRLHGTETTDLCADLERSP